MQRNDFTTSRFTRVCKVKRNVEGRNCSLFVRHCTQHKRNLAHDTYQTRLLPALEIAVISHVWVNWNHGKLKVQVASAEAKSNCMKKMCPARARALIEKLSFLFNCAYFSYSCRSIRVPADASSWRRLSLDAEYDAEDLRSVRQRHHENSSEATCKIFVHHRYEVRVKFALTRLCSLLARIGKLARNLWLHNSPYTIVFRGYN